MKTLVLLSGGLDSTAALIRAAHDGAEGLAAIWFYYAQPASHREVYCALKAADAVDATFYRCDLQSVVHGATTGLMLPQDHALIAGRNTAFLPGRNAMLLATAAARAGTLWGSEEVDLVVGFNTEDAGGFPDCTAAFIDAMGAALRQGGARVRITAPWLTSSKAEIIAWVSAHAPERMALLEASWSCYRHDGPCGACTPCVSRAEAGFPSPRAPR